MSCQSDELRQVPLFSLLDDDELAILRSQVELSDFAPHHGIAIPTEPTACIETDRNDPPVLLEKRPQAGLDMLTVFATEIHTAQRVIRSRTLRNPHRSEE